MPDVELCDVVAPCPVYELGRARGRRAPAGRDRHAVAGGHLRPRGRSTRPGGRGEASTANQFNAEAFVGDPRPGTWTVRVVPAARRDASSGCAPSSSAAAHAGRARRRCCRTSRRCRRTSSASSRRPTRPTAAYPPDTVNPPLSVAGRRRCPARPTSWRRSRPAAPGRSDCLRLTTGPDQRRRRAVRQALHVRRRPRRRAARRRAATSAARAAGAPLRRRDARASAPAGTYSFHMTHAHFHDDNILTYELFRVDGDGAARPRAARDEVGLLPGRPAVRRLGQLRPGRRRATSARATRRPATASSPDRRHARPDPGLGRRLPLAAARPVRGVRRQRRRALRGPRDGRQGHHDARDRRGRQRLATRWSGSRAARRADRARAGPSHLDPGKTVFGGYGPASQDRYGGELAAPCPGPRSPPRSRRRIAWPPPSARVAVRGRRVGVHPERGRHGPADGEAGRLDEGAVAPALRRAARRCSCPSGSEAATGSGLVARDAAGNASAAVSRRVRLR